MQEAKDLIAEYEGKKPPSLQLFLEYLDLTEKEFNQIIAKTVVSPHQPNFQAPEAPKTADYDTWFREPPEGRGIRHKPEISKKGS